MYSQFFVGFCFKITVKIDKNAKSGHQKSESLKQTQFFFPDFIQFKNCEFSCISLIYILTIVECTAFVLTAELAKCLK